jgi:hypothetical protein
MSYEEKYIKYKDKYLSLKNKLRFIHYGTGDNSFEMQPGFELPLKLKLSPQHPPEFFDGNLVGEIFTVKRTGRSEENIYKHSTMNVITFDPRFQYIKINDSPIYYFVKILGSEIINLYKLHGIKLEYSIYKDEYYIVETSNLENNIYLPPIVSEDGGYIPSPSPTSGGYVPMPVRGYKINEIYKMPSIKYPVQMSHTEEPLKFTINMLQGRKFSVIYTSASGIGYNKEEAYNSISDPKFKELSFYSENHSWEQKTISKVLGSFLIEMHLQIIYKLNYIIKPNNYYLIERTSRDSKELNIYRMP